MALAESISAFDHANAASPSVDLPGEEQLSEWSVVLAKYGLREGVGGLRIESGGRCWRLSVDAVGGRREAVVAIPRTPAQREAFAALAASLLSPGPSIAPPAARLPPQPVAAPPRAPAPEALQLSRKPVKSPVVGVGVSVPADPSLRPAPSIATAIVAESEAAAAPAPVAPSIATAPVSEAAPSPRAAPSMPVTAAPPTPPRPAAEAAPRPSRAPSVVPVPHPLAVRASLGLAGDVVVHPGLDATFGGGGDVRMQVGGAFVSLSVGAASPADVGSGLGSLAVAHFGGDLGATVLDVGATQVRVGGGGGALLWSVHDLSGDREAWSADVELLAMAEQRLGGNAAIQGGLAAVYDFQEIKVLGGSESPAPLMLRVFFGIRVGR